MKKRIRLTEGDLHRIIRQCVNEALWDKKRNEIMQSWDDLKHQYRYGSPHTYYQAIGKYDNGYNRKHEVPQEELEMYKAMGNPSQYATKAEPQKWRGWTKGRSPLRSSDGGLSIAAQTVEDPKLDTHYTDPDGYNLSYVTPEYARDPRNFMGDQGIEDLEIERDHRDSAEAEAEAAWFDSRLEESIRRTVRRALKR